MNWLARLFGKKAAPLNIPPYKPPPIEVRANSPKPSDDPGIEVDEVDTSDMTKTGVHRAWKRMTGQRD